MYLYSQLANYVSGAIDCSGSTCSKYVHSVRLQETVLVHNTINRLKYLAT